MSLITRIENATAAAILRAQGEVRRLDFRYRRTEEGPSGDMVWSAVPVAASCADDGHSLSAAGGAETEPSASTTRPRIHAREGSTEVRRAAGWVAVSVRMTISLVAEPSVWTGLTNRSNRMARWI